MCAAAVITSYYIAVLRIRIDYHVISLWRLDLVFLNVSYENPYLFIQVTSILVSGSIVDMSLCKVGNVCQQASLQISEPRLWSFSSSINTDVEVVTSCF